MSKTLNLQYKNCNYDHHLFISIKIDHSRTIFIDSIKRDNISNYKHGSTGRNFRLLNINISIRDCATETASENRFSRHDGRPTFPPAVTPPLAAMIDGRIDRLQYRIM